MPGLFWVVNPILWTGSGGGLFEVYPEGHENLHRSKLRSALHTEPVCTTSGVPYGEQMLTKPPLDDLVYEADVETKFVFPFLVATSPYGLGIPQERIILKHNIRRFLIDKGAEQKSYFPDFIASFDGIPVLIVEVKRPGESALEGFRQARLYAAELNSAYPSGVNPASYVLATNGKDWLAGKSDQSVPVVSATYEEIDVYALKTAEIIELLGFDSLKKAFENVAKVIKPSRYFKPTRRIGGAGVRNQEVRSNTFGSTISSELAHLFNPVRKDDRRLIASRAYIRSSHRSKYFEPIDKIIRAAAPPSELDSKLIKDIGQPAEVIAALEQGARLEQKIMLVIGSVGSGKTTFVDHLQGVAISKEMRDKTLWVHINMNSAPLHDAEIYKFLREEIVSEIRMQSADVDTEEYDVLSKIYSVEINKFNKGVGRLYESNSEVFNLKKAEVIERAQSDLHLTATCFCRYFGTERGKLVIIVLDNCDKRTRDEQLFMFQAAQWLQKEFRALIILPLRDETYDNHRDEAPLDTALKDLVFRIEPPAFENVLTSRVELALEELSKSAPKNHTYTLPNGMQIKYAASEQAHYLACIVSTIFHRAGEARKLIVGLSGKNLRRAFEIFLEFCKSGHIGDEAITKIIQGDNISIPGDVVLRVLLRKNRRYYDDESSYLRNIFACNIKDERPIYFSNYLILNWLKDRWAEPGPTRIKGYHRIADMIADLAPCGLNEKVVIRQTEILASAGCLSSEDFRSAGLTSETLVKLAPAGFLHLEVASDPQYLSAISEDTWFDDASVANRVTTSIGDSENQYKPRAVFYNAQDLLIYLDGHRGRDMAYSPGVKTDHLYDMPELLKATDEVQKLATKLQLGPWATADLRFPPGMEVSATVDGVANYGLFVALAPGLVGLAHLKNLAQPLENYQKG